MVSSPAFDKELLSDFHAIDTDSFRHDSMSFDRLPLLVAWLTTSGGGLGYRVLVVLMIQGADIALNSLFGLC